MRQSGWTENGVLDALDLPVRNVGAGEDDGSLASCSAPCASWKT